MEDWQKTTLGEVATLQRGVDLPSQDRRDGPYPVIGSNGVVGYHQDHVAEGPGVCVGRSGSVGRVVFVSDPYWPLNTALWVKDFHGNDPRFVAYFLEHLDLGRFGAGVSVPTLNRNLLHPLEVSVPSVTEQRAVAHVLSVVQRAREQTEQVIAAARELKRSLMQRLFSVGPGKSGTDTEPPVETEIGPMPATWKLVRLDDVLDTQLGKMLSPKARGGVSPRPYLRNVDVQWGRVDISDLLEMDFSPTEREKFSLRIGDILVCEGGEPGRTAIWRGQLDECYFQKALHRLRPRDARLLPHFFLYHMDNAIRLRGAYGIQGTKTTIAHLPGVKLKALPIPLPPLEEQEEVAAVLEAADRKIEVEEQRRDAMDALFRSLLHDLMSARIRVDPLTATFD